MAGLRVSRVLATVVLTGALALTAVTPAAFCDAERKAKTRVAPAYPEMARHMNVSGTVKVEITITPAGLVKSTKVIGGHPLLLDPAVQAVRKWKFEPASRETTQVVEFNFTNQ